VSTRMRIAANSRVVGGGGGAVWMTRRSSALLRVSGTERDGGVLEEVLEVVEV